MSTLDAGRLRHKVTVEAETSPQQRNNPGEPIDDWRPFLTARADVRTVSGQAIYYAQQRQIQASHVVTIRYRRGVTERMRVDFWGAKLYVVAAIDPDGQRVQLDLYCLERR